MALTQKNFRFGVNDGNETNHTWLAAQDANPTAGLGQTLALDTTFLLRFGIQNAASTQGNIDFTFQYQIGALGWVTITTTSAAVKAVNGVLTDGGDCTNRITGMSGTFQGVTGQTEDGTSGGNSMDIASSGCAETICALQLVSAGLADGDVLTFRLLQEGSTLGTYTATPTLTIIKNLRVSTISEAAKPADTVTTSLNPLNSPVMTEAAKLGDSLPANPKLNPLETAAILTEGTTAKLADTLTAILDALASVSESGKLADTVTASREEVVVDLSVVIDVESLKIADALTAIEDETAALSESLKIADAVTAILDLNAVPPESLTITDALTVGINLDNTSLSETLRLIDGPKTPDLFISDVIAAEITGVGGDLDASLAESLKVADALTALHDDYAVLAESLKIADAVTVSLDLNASVTDALTLADALTSVIDLNAIVSESLKVADSVTAIEDARASLSESGALADAVTAARGLDAVLAESLTVADALTAIEDETAALSESAKVIDTITVSRDLTAAPTEALAITDAVTAVIGPAWIYASSLVLNGGAIVSGTLEDTYSDNGVRLVLSEIGSAPAMAYEFVFGEFDPVPLVSIHVHVNGYYDGTLGHLVRLQMYRYSTGTWVTIPQATFPTATSDQTSEWTLLEPLANYHSGGQIRLRIDHPAVGDTGHQFRLDHLYLEAGLVQYLNDEGLTPVDAVTAELPILETAPAESGRLTDALTVARDLTATLGTDSLLVVDAVTVSRGLSAVLVASALTLTDTVAAELPVLETAVNEAVALTDTVSAGNTLIADLTDVMSVTDAVSARLSHLDAAVSEGAVVTDTVTAQPDLVGVVSEAARATDVLAATLDPLDAGIAESARVSDLIIVGNQLAVAVAAEGLQVADVLTPSINPILLVLGAEALTPRDTVTASLPLLRLVVAPESVVITDAGSAVRDLAAGVAESGRLSDLVAAERSVLEAVVSEGLRLTEFVTPSVAFLDAQIGEAGRLADVLHVARGLDATGADALTVADVLAAAMNLAARPAESGRLAETVTVEIDPLAVTLPAALVRLRDTAAALIGIEIVLSEVIHLGEFISAGDPRGEIVHVETDDRLVVVPPEVRGTVTDDDPVIVAVGSEDRAVAIPAEDRVLIVPVRPTP